MWANFNFGEMWCGNKKGGDDHMKENEKILRRPGVKQQNVLSQHSVGA